MRISHPPQQSSTSRFRPAISVGMVAASLLLGPAQPMAAASPQPTGAAELHADAVFRSYVAWLSEAHAQAAVRGNAAQLPQQF